MQNARLNNHRAFCMRKDCDVMRINAENKSIVFSEVELSVGSSGICFLASGIPDQYDVEDLDQFIEFTEGLDEEADIDVSVRSYVFGRGQSEHADESELEYIEAHREEIESEYGIDMIQSGSFSVFYEPVVEYED